MDHGPDSLPAQRLRLAFALREAGVALQRQNLRRRHPETDTRSVAPTSTGG
jgi:hypothetical protein